MPIESRCLIPNLRITGDGPGTDGGATSKHKPGE